MSWNRNAVIAHVIDMEGGYHALPYHTVKGVCIGMGFCLEGPAAKATCRAHGLDWQRLFNGKAKLGYQDALAIVEDRILACKFAAGCVMPNFDELPEPVQIAVIDLEYAIGHDAFMRFPETVAAINRGDFAAFARELRGMKWFEAAGLRAGKDAELITQEVEA